jgi:uncharacterized protein with FMN-binding domain
MSLPQVARTGRNATVLAATAAATVLLFLYPTSTNSRSSGPRTQTAPPAGIVSPSTTPGKAAGSAKTSKPVVVVNGGAADTDFGPVQVQLKVSGGRIVSATAINYPQESGHDRRINSYAIPVLQQETVSAQNAQIDTVSGATFTSNGYRQSLQSALDAAHLH